MKKNLIKKKFYAVAGLWIVMACFSACSDSNPEGEKMMPANVTEEQVKKTENGGRESVIDECHVSEISKDQKAPEGTLLTYFLAASEAILPESFITNVTDDSPVTKGFRNVQLISDDPTDFEIGIPNWTMEKDCYEEAGADGEALLKSFAAEKDGLYSMEVVCADSYGNASVAKVYVLFVTEELSASWVEEPVKETIDSENSVFTGFDRARAEQAFTEVNNQRTASGLQPLSWDESLYDLACTRAQEIVSSFSHQRPDGSYVGDVIIRQYGASGCGENIAANYRSITNLINGWMSSAGHRETMLDVRFSMGVMACYCHEGTYYWVNLFKQ